MILTARDSLNVHFLEADDLTRHSDIRRHRLLLTLHSRAINHRELHILKISVETQLPKVIDATPV